MLVLEQVEDAPQKPGQDRPWAGRGAQVEAAAPALPCTRAASSFLPYGCGRLGLRGVSWEPRERCHGDNLQAGMGWLWAGLAPGSDAAPFPQHRADPCSPMGKDSAAVLSPAAPDAALTLV